MQITKEAVRQNVLNAARREFSKNGFRDAKLRVIAKNAGCSLSNVYTYFKNKDMLFTEVLKPTVTKIKQALRNIQNESPPPGKLMVSYQQNSVMTEKVMKFVECYRDDLKLLAFSAEGSRLHDFKDYVIDEYTDICVANLERLRKSESRAITTKFSKFFVHNTSAFYVNTIVEMLMHNVGYAEMQRCAEQVIKFSYYGYAALIKNQERTLKKKTNKNK